MADGVLQDILGGQEDAEPTSDIEAPGAPLADAVALSQDGSREARSYLRLRGAPGALHASAA